MRYLRVAQEIGKIILLLIIPVLLIFKLKWDAILPIIIYLQFLLIWIQAEISLRQNTLFSLQYGPYFDVKLNKGNQKSLLDYISIKNISKNPAYEIGIGRVLNRDYQFIPPEKWKDKITSDFIGVLPPNEEKTLGFFKDVDFFNDFFKNGLSIEVSYINPLGEWKEFCIRGIEKENKIMVFMSSLRQPGFLLNTFENIAAIFKYLKYSKFRKVLKRHTKINH